MKAKKFVMLFTFTAIAASAIVVSGNLLKSSVVTVSTVKVNPITAENSVLCTGKVERVATRNIFVPSVSITKDICVNVGDQVTYGTTLLTAEPVQTAISTEEIQETYRSLLSSYYEQLNGGDLPESFTEAIAAAAVPQEAPSLEEIKAPVSGEIIAINTYEQNYTDPSRPVMVIASAPGLQVRLTVNESQISDIKVGQRAVISGVGFRNDTFTGQVKNISSEAKQTVTASGQETIVEVLVSVDDPTEEIKPGFTAKAKIITSESSDVLVAPYEAVRADNNGNEYVFKLVGKNAVKAPVKTKNEFETGLEIISGIKESDIIITNPDKVYNGAIVVTETGSGK